VFAHNNFEFAVDPAVKPAPQIARFGTFKRDPIDVAGAGEHLTDAVQLMNEVGWN
jgi:iron(III) transport system substrate-binding protein